MSAWLTKLLRSAPNAWAVDYDFTKVGQILPGMCGMFYRQTTKLYRIGHIIGRNKCGQTVDLGGLEGETERQRIVRRPARLGEQLEPGELDRAIEWGRRLASLPVLAP